MAITPVTLDGDVSTLLPGVEFDPRRIQAVLETNVPPGEILVDTSTGGQVHLGAGAVAIAEDGTFTVDLLPTDSEDLNWGNLQYRLTFTFTDLATRKGGQRGTTGWFDITESTNVRDIVERDYLPPTARSQAVAELQGMIDDATGDIADDVSAAQAARTGAEAEADRAEAAADLATDISNIDTTDDAVDVVLNLPGGKAQATLKTTFATRVSRAKHAPAFGLYFPEAEGAVGDGVADDANALNDTATAIRLADGRAQMMLQAGRTYLISTPINRNWVSVSGYGATIKVQGGTSMAGFSALLSNDASRPGCTIAGVRIDMNKANTVDAGFLAGVGIMAIGEPGLSVVDVAVVNGHQAGVVAFSPGAITDSEAAPPLGVSIERVTVEDCGGAGVHLSAIADATVSNCMIASPGGPGIFFNLCRQVRVAGNAVTDGADHGILATYSSDLTVTGNVCEGNVEGGITIGGGDDALAPARRVAISGNVCRDNGTHGIWLDVTRESSGVSSVPLGAAVTGNVCEGNGIHGVYVQQSAHVAMSGNLCEANASCGIAVSATHATISGNVCHNNGGHGVALFGNESYPDFGHHRIGVNDVSDNVLGGYHVESAEVSDVKWAALATSAPV